MDRVVEGINERGRDAQFSLLLAAKDAELIAETAQEEGVEAPVAAAIAHVMDSAVAAGLGDRDWSDLVELIEAHSATRIELPPRRDDDSKTS